MQHAHSLAAVSLRDSWLTIGVFDGVHRGHQEIIRELTAGAHADRAPAVLLTFSPHPAVVLAGSDLKHLTTLEERVELLAEMGLDTVITYPFTRQVAERSAEDFMLELKRHLDLRHLLIGYDFALGKKRTGDYARLSAIGAELGYGVRAFEAFRLDGEIVSSTLIRQLIANGDVAAAAVKLGRPYALTGTVIRGDGRGRTIGVPTANLDFPLEKAIPANGVYACWAMVEGAQHKAMVNVGVRPTFTSGEVLSHVEAHLLNYEADLYGKKLQLRFVERLRSEQKFSSVEALVAQIKADIARGDALLNNPQFGVAARQN